MFKDNANLYPTPEKLAIKMLSMADWKDVKNILEPSAGLGHLINSINEHKKYNSMSVSAIEIDNDCRNILIGNGVNVIDSDFLLYNGLEQFDLIVANFPFSDGDKHLHKAIDILFSGQIVCLLNAETLKNPYSNSRKDLVQKLKNLDAKIEYIQNAFVDAERKTGVEVALIYISKIRDVESELFNNLDNDSNDETIEIKDSTTIATKDDIYNLVQRYNQDKESVLNQIMDFYKNYKKVSKYLALSVVGSELERHQQNVRLDGRQLTDIMKSKLNDFSIKIKRDYWLMAMDLKEVSSRLTSQKKRELSAELNKYCNMDFTVDNIKIFIENIKAKYPKMIDEAIEYIFDKFTQYAFRDGRNANNEYSQNIHMYNGWKTNEAYKVNKKVILPFTRGSYLASDKRDFFDDIDMVFNYFDSENIQNEVLEYKVGRYSYAKEGTTATTQKTSEIVAVNLDEDITKNIKTRYFTVTLYKKGTIHFVFNDLEMLRRFNIFIGKRRNYLPSDYGYTEKRNKDIDFETDKEYRKIGNELAINTKNILMLN